jgi:2-amino-4-hydroxy-6-hydroxymethyldihydropteridine diphosphokinase
LPETMVRCFLPMPKSKRYYLSLGSNLGRKRDNLARARRQLEEAGIRVRRASSLYRTQPVGFKDQPWFYNQVVEAEACLSALELLDAVKRIERRMKREPARRNGPRRIDIDILLAGPTVVSSPRLVIPHPRLARRNFVLRPLAEIAPRAIHPVLEVRVEELAEASPDRSAVVRLGPASIRPPRRKRRSAGA